MIRALFTSVSWVFTAATLLFLFFILLAGTKDATPLNQFYWLEADTSQIANAPDITRWTPYGYCQVSDGRNSNCTSNKADFPFDPVNNFAPQQSASDGIPQPFIDNRDTYYYLSRFAYPFYLIGTFFEVIVLFIGLFAMRSRLVAAISSLSSFLALLFVAAASALVTACFTMARSDFNSAGMSASLGRYMMAWTWVATFLLLVTFFTYCCGCCVPKRRHHHDDDVIVAGGERSSFEKSSGAGGKRGFFNVGSHNGTSETAAPSTGFFHHSAANEPAGTGVQGERSSFERL